MRFRLLLVTSLAAVACLLAPSLPLRLALFLAHASIQFDSARWQGWGLLEVRQLEYRDSLRMEAITLQLTPALLLGRIQEVRIYGAQGWLSRLSSPPSTGNGIPLRINRLLIANSVLQLDNLGPGIPSAPLRLGDPTPLLFTDVRLGSKVPGEAASELQSATIEHLVFYSPFDPLAPVLEFPRIDLAFTWDGITQGQLENLRFVEPTIFLGDDLFAFDERITTHPDTSSPSQPFQIRHFEIEEGRLAISLYGQPVLKLPVRFAAEQENLILRDFTEIQLATKIVIPPTDLDFPAQGVSVHNLRGNLFFSLGRDASGARAENIVPTVFADRLTYEGLSAENLSLSVTVNADGIFGRADARLGGGVLDGGLSLYFNNDLPWTAWSTIRGMESRVVTDALCSTSMRLTSKVDANAYVSAQGKEIRGGFASMTFRHGGRLQIPALDGTENRIPKDWNWIKQGAAKAALGVIQNYGFDSGEIRATFQPPAARLTLNLQGREGKRDIELNWLARNNTHFPFHLPPSTNAPISHIRYPISSNYHSISYLYFNLNLIFYLN